MMNLPCLSLEVGKNDDIDHDNLYYILLSPSRFRMSIHKHVHLIPNSSSCITSFLQAICMFNACKSVIILQTIIIIIVLMQDTVFKELSCRI